MDVEKLLALSAAATQWGVLRLRDYDDGTSHNRIFEHLTGRLIADSVDGPDAAFIASAREHFPELLRRWKRLRELFIQSQYTRLGMAVMTQDNLAEIMDLLEADLPAEGK